MAAINTHITCPLGEATQLTDNLVTAARVVSTKDFYLLATTDDTKPTSVDGGISMQPFSILSADLALENLFPGVGTSFHLWAYPTASRVQVSISHVAAA